ncbi:MAG: BrnT family toxin [Casimicrobiaceae bacterium]
MEQFAKGDKCLYTITLRIRWDSDKADANLAAHGASFSEAATVLEDDFALTREDPDAVDEQRFVTLGISGPGNLLVVVYAYRNPDIVRIISAWKANKRQRLQYEKARS